MPTLAWPTPSTVYTTAKNSIRRRTLSGSDRAGMLPASVRAAGVALKPGLDGCGPHVQWIRLDLFLPLVLLAANAQMPSYPATCCVRRACRATTNNSLDRIGRAHGGRRRQRAHTAGTARARPAARRVGPGRHAARSPFYAHRRAADIRGDAGHFRRAAGVLVLSELHRLGDGSAAVHRPFRW